MATTINNLEGNKRNKQLQGGRYRGRQEEEAEQGEAGGQDQTDTPKKTHNVNRQKTNIKNVEVESSPVEQQPPPLMPLEEGEEASGGSPHLLQSIFGPLMFGTFVFEVVLVMAP